MFLYIFWGSPSPSPFFHPALISCELISEILLTGWKDGCEMCLYWILYPGYNSQVFVHMGLDLRLRFRYCVAQNKTSELIID